MEKTDVPDSESETPAWVEFAVSYNLTCGSTYWICLQPSAGSFYDWYNTTVGANSYKFIAHTYADAWPSSFGTPDGGNDDVSISRKAHYTY